MNQTQKLKVGYGFGLEFKMMGLQSDFSKLDHTQLRMRIAPHSTGLFCWMLAVQLRRLPIWTL